MSSRATLIILLALIAGCQDIGTLRRPAHEGKRARLDDSLDSLLAVPMHIRCDRAIVAVSPDQRKQIQIFGEQLSLTPSGGAAGTGKIRVLFRTLKVDCENLLLTVHPERVAYFRLMAADKVQVKRVETSFSARLLTIEDGRMTYAGAPKLRINWSLPVSKPPTQKK